MKPEKYISRLRLALGLQSHARLHAGGGRGLVEFARVAEDAGFDGIVIGDHVVIGPRLDRYPYPPVHFAVDDPWLEPMTVLAAAAAITSRIILATGVLVTPLRPAVLLAKTAATLDAISGGRFELGVGVGWQPEEFAAIGADFERRGELLTDGLRACRALWSEFPASYSGSSVAFDQVWCCPRPAQGSGIPLLFSGSLHERNMTRIVEQGVGWITPPGLPLLEISSGIRLLRERYTREGRDPDGLRVRTRLPISSAPDGQIDLSPTFKAIQEYAEAGVTDLTVWTKSLTGSPELIADRIRDFGTAWTEWRAQFRAPARVDQGSNSPGVPL